MERQEIEAVYEKLGIDIGQYPQYYSADEYAQNFKRCGITKNVIVTTSASSGMSNTVIKQ